MTLGVSEIEYPRVSEHSGLLDHIHKWNSPQSNDTGKVKCGFQSYPVSHPAGDHQRRRLTPKTDGQKNTVEKCGPLCPTVLR